MFEEIALQPIKAKMLSSQTIKSKQNKTRFIIASLPLAKTFSRARNWFHVFPHSVQVAIFPALATRFCMVFGLVCCTLCEHWFLVEKTSENRFK